MRGAMWALVGGLLLAGCTDPSGTLVGPEAPPPAKGGRIEGVVVDDQHAPLKDAQAALLGIKPARETSTDAAGRFVFDGLEPGSYNVAVSKLGYESEILLAAVKEREVTHVSFALEVLPVRGEPYHTVLIGQGYIACGAYLIVVTISNLNVCAWDTNHKPRFEFTLEREGLMGVLQEVAWVKNSALTSEKLIVYLWYKPVCNPTCSAAKQFAAANAPSPIRLYSNLEDGLKQYQDDPFPLASMTFVGGDGLEVVVVYQQRITHYITAFYNVHGDLTQTALP